MKINYVTVVNSDNAQKFLMAENEVKIVIQREKITSKVTCLFQMIEFTRFAILYWMEMATHEHMCHLNRDTSYFFVNRIEDDA